MQKDQAAPFFPFVLAPSSPSSTVATLRRPTFWLPALCALLQAVLMWRMYPLKTAALTALVVGLLAVTAASALPLIRRSRLGLLVFTCGFVGGLGMLTGSLIDAAGAQAGMAAAAEHAHHHHHMGAAGGAGAAAAHFQPLSWMNLLMWATCIPSCALVCRGCLHGSRLKRFSVHLSHTVGMTVGMVIGGMLLAEPLTPLLGASVGMHLAMVVGMMVGIAAADLCWMPWRQVAPKRQEAA